jgi:hypothetical protein
MTADQITARSWRDERRDDHLTRARIEREAESARTANQIARQEAKATIRREAEQAREQARQTARYARAARRAARMAWVRAHTVDLLFIPVILVPGVLAWMGMAAYGAAEYGTPGMALPALSEGGMWTFAAATTIRRREDDQARELDPAAEPRPLWHMRLGTLIFAGYGAVLNFLHGLTQGGPVTGVTMALVSVAGVTAHQLITAGPRRSKADRDHARITRLITRREQAASRAAVRNAPVELDEHGTARLVLTPGLAQPGCPRWRIALNLSPAPAQPAQDQRGPVEPPAQPVQPPEDDSTVRETPNTGPGHDNPRENDPAHTEQPEPPDTDSTDLTDEQHTPELSDTDRAAAELWLATQEQEGDDGYTKALKALRRSTLAGNALSGRELERRYGISRTQKEEIVAAIGREFDAP